MSGTEKKTDQLVALYFADTLQGDTTALNKCRDHLHAALFVTV